MSFGISVDTLGRRSVRQPPGIAEKVEPHFSTLLRRQGQIVPAGLYSPLIKSDRTLAPLREFLRSGRVVIVKTLEQFPEQTGYSQAVV